MQQTRLLRSESDKMIAGVCGGLASYLGVDPVLVRLAFVILLLASGVGFPIYIVLWIIMPTTSSEQAEVRILSEEMPGDPSTYKNNRLSPAATVGIILIAFGAFFLLGQMGQVPGFIWPLILIAAGIFYLFRRAR